MITQAMLMAAGLGTRLRPFTDLEPKALMPLMGIPSAQFAVDALVKAGVQRIVANVHHHAERARSGLLALERGQAEMLISDESDLLLGSAGGLRKALPLFQGKPFFLLNADVLCEISLEALARQHERLRARDGVRMTLAVMERAPAGGKYREILLDPARRKVTGFGELAAESPFFVGAAVIEPEAVSEVPPEGPAEFVPSMLTGAIRDQAVGTYLMDGQWHDVGSPKLWLDTHMALIRSLETGRTPALWRKRIESINKRVGQFAWTSIDSPARTRTSGWCGPCYWNPERNSTADAPAFFGPRAVMYGGAPSIEAFGDGIGFRGLWVSA